MRIKHLTQATSAKYKTTAVCASMKQMLPAHCPPQALCTSGTQKISQNQLGLWGQGVPVREVGTLIWGLVLSYEKRTELQIQVHKGQVVWEAQL